MRHVHVIGAGMAGLAAAVACTTKGLSVTLYESAGHAGGRCRSLFDAKLDRLIDNGNHLLLSGNTSVRDYLSSIGASSAIVGPQPAAFDFIDVRSGMRWVVRPNRGPFPWWIFSEARRVPDTRWTDYLSALKILSAGPNDTVGQKLNEHSILYERFWEPLAVGALNTPAAHGAARLLRPVLLETFARGEAYCRPLVARDGLSRALVDPALKFLEQRSMPYVFNTRLRGIKIAGSHVRELDFGDRGVRLAYDDAVVLATPSWITSRFLPYAPAPDIGETIVNAHFLLREPPVAQAPLIGVIGGASQWVFVRGDVASVTVSAASHLTTAPTGEIATALWPDVVAALELEDRRLPVYRIIKEKRATFAQTCQEIRKRPPARTDIKNLVLAGDWTNTGLPATIEGAIRSGYRAAALLPAW